MKLSSTSVFEKNSFVTDKFIPDHSVIADLGGDVAGTIDFLCENQLLRTDLWELFERQFGKNADDADAGWRCEYWGKTMRGAAFVCACTRDEKLYGVMRDSILRLMSYADGQGRISTYPADNEFRGWDIWGRKYILLGMQYFYEICDDEELKEKLRDSMRAQADYMISRLGKDKLPIEKASNHWLGINSMSVLEPIVRLYNLTGERRYLDFAAYIVETGETAEACIFRLAYEDELYPYQYPTNKAYEMMSCFEGLIEYYRATGIERYRTAALNFGNKLLESEISVIGCCGCTHELFDHTAVTQTDDKYQGIMQETCVSVTLMKLCAQLLRLSGDVRYADVIEKTFFNAYLGAFNTHGIISRIPAKNGLPEAECVLPVDSYSPLRIGTRGKKIGGLRRMDEGKYFYGCCVCISAAGVGLVPKVTLLRSEKGFCLNLYQAGRLETSTLSGQKLIFEIDGGYPYGNKAGITVSLAAPEKMTLTLRIPEWSKTTSVAVNGEAMNAAPGYVDIEREWKDGDRVELTFDGGVYGIIPEYNAGKYRAYRKGCIVLAADARLGFDKETVFEAGDESDPSVKFSDAACPEIPDSRVCVELDAGNGRDKIRLIDYASAGKTYDESSAFAAWIRMN